MGKKTRTRRTKWRRLSLGEASGPEEEDDEIQQQPQQQQQQHEEGDHQSSDVVVLHSDELSGDEQFAQKDSPLSSTVADGISNNKSNNSNTSGQELEGEEERGAHTEMMVSNHHQQNNQQQQPQRGGQQPTWKLPANQQQQPGNKPGGYYNANNGYTSGNGGRPANATNSNGQQFRGRGGGGGNNGPRYNNGSFNGGGGYGGAGGYGRANSWNSSAASSYNGDHHHHHHHHQQPAGLSKMHGIEKKIFNDEEYTKISTPRQEVLFKKGSIGAKKRVSTTTTPATPLTDSGSEQDSVNGNATSPVSPAQGDVDSFQYSGNDSGSTGDASSTAGEAQSPDAASASAIAAASGAALQQGYADGAPLVCFPMYDFYGGYGGMYPGSMLVQAYPGGPIVAAVPVPVPVQTIDWYRGGAGGGAGAAGAAANGTGGPAGGGEVSYYYALSYPAGSEMAGQLETSSSSRRNSLESYQASSQEVMTGSEASSSENSSPCSTGPSSQGPASPQGELVSPAIDPKAQTGGGVATAAAAAAVVMDMTMDNRKMAAAAAGPSFVYPYAAAYCLAPPALYTSGSVCDANNYYYDDDCGDVVYYEHYDGEEAMDVNADEPVDACGGGAGAGPLLEPSWKVLEDGKGAVGQEEPVVVLTDQVGGRKLPGRDGAMTSSTSARTTTTTLQVDANPPAGTGRRKKRRKKRNKTRLERASQPRVTDDGDEEEEEEEVAAVPAEKECEEKEATTSTSSISRAAADGVADAAAVLIASSDDPLLDPHQQHQSSLETPAAPLSSSPSTESTPTTLTTMSTSTSVEPFELLLLLSSTSNAPSAAPESSTVECSGAIPTPTPTPLLCHEEKSGHHCVVSLAESSVAAAVSLSDPPETLETLEPPAFCSTPSFPLESSTRLFVVPFVPPRGDDDVLQSSRQQPEPTVQEEDDPLVILQLDKSSNPVVASASPVPTQVVQEPVASDLLVCDDPASPVDKDHPSDLPSSSNSSNNSDSIEEDSLMGNAKASVDGCIDRDSLDGDDDGASSSDDFVYLQLDERDEEAPGDGYFDDEPNGMVGSSDPSLMHLTPQLWRTVILEESEPNSKEMSPLLCSDSGIVAGTPSPPVSTAETSSPSQERVGPITKAVSLWLESAPIQQQLLIAAASSSAALTDDEDDDLVIGNDDDDYQEDEVMEEMVSAPKNGLATLRTAPSSDGSVTDGPLRRVDPSLVEPTTAADAQDLPLCPVAVTAPVEEEPPVQPLSQHCDPAKFSVYYQLGVSVDQDVGGDTVLEDSAALIAKSNGMDDSIEQCPSTCLLSTEEAAQAVATKKRRKRNAWRRILLLHRAVHKSRRSSSDDANAPTTADNFKTSRRLKSGPACCALQ